MILDVKANLRSVAILPTSTLEEIVQNVQMILATIKGTVPLDRDFGVSSKVLDMPINAAQAKISAEIVTAINKFEPRVKVKKCIFGNDLDGLSDVTVRIEVMT